jgi:hypothetical protein
MKRHKLGWGGAGVAVIAVAAGVSLAAVGCGSAATRSPGGLKPAPPGTLRPAPAPGTDGYEGVPVPEARPLAGTATMATGQAVDGIGCESHEHSLFHVHAHLTIIVNGTRRQVPAGVGIPVAKEAQSPTGPYIKSGKCFYWLHTHAPDGVIHIESPVRRGFTLGDFFDEWGQPLGADLAGPARGRVTAFYDGKVYRGNPRDIPLVGQAQIQLEVGTPLVAPDLITFPTTVAGAGTRRNAKS